MELVLEQTQQVTSYEVSVIAEGVEELKRKLKIKGEKKEALLILRQKPGVESYQKKLNLTKPDTFRSNLKNKTTYTAYSDLKGVIYKDQNNRNRLMYVDELHKFSDGTLDDVRSALNDIAKGIRWNICQRGNGVA
ncbi:hypothetical protein Tco_0409572 [Tanacetum coccineum]